MKLLDTQYANAAFYGMRNDGRGIFAQPAASEGAVERRYELMNLIDLEAFVSVVDRGSIVAAAAGPLSRSRL